MINLNLIFTRHQEFGNCNSKRLLKIIEELSPEIIFEELEIAVYDRIYKENKQTTLETDAIKEYLSKQDISHIPVDTLPRPTKFHQDCDMMLNKITGMASRDAFDFRNSLDYQITLVGEYGFDFLNSDNNDKLLQEIDSSKEKVLNAIDDNRLHQISAMQRDINEKREEIILDNIYSYCKDHSIGQAILFLGSVTGNPC